MIDFFDPATRLANAHALADEACLRANEGRFVEALNLFDEALRWCPDSPECHFNFAAGCCDLARWDEAIQHFRIAAKGKFYPDAHKNLGYILLLLGRLDEGWPEWEWRVCCREWFEHWQAIRPLLTRIPHFCPVYPYGSLPHFTRP